jgi:cobalamin biosynthesis protein CobD/CbiB
MKVYGSAFFLVVVAMVLLTMYWLGMATELTGPAALLFLGSAVTKFLDIHRDRQVEAHAEKEHRRNGLDKTRRQLYAIRWSVGEPSSELTATVVNALVHQHHIWTENTADGLAFRLQRCNRLSGKEENHVWIEGLIKELSARRDAIEG